MTRACVAPLAASRVSPASSRSTLARTSAFVRGFRRITPTVARVFPRRDRASPSATRAELPPLVPADADDALGRFRKVMTVLYAAGGALHFPDLLGRGPISAACGVDAFGDLSPILQAVTVGWAALGPIAAFGLATERAWGDAVLVGVASTEVVLGVDFADAMAPSPIPAPVVAAQVTCLASVVGIYLWKKREEEDQVGA